MWHNPQTVRTTTLPGGWTANRGQHPRGKKTPVHYLLGNYWTVTILVALAWTAIVTYYVLNGLRPHGYIEDLNQAAWTWLACWAGGGLLLGWIVRKFWFDVLRWYQPMCNSAAEGDSSDEDVPVFESLRHDDDSEERRYARGEWSIYDSDELDFGR